MALNIDELRKVHGASGHMYVNDTGERLCLTEDGKLVGGTDPRGRTLLVGAGGTIPWYLAAQHGLVEPEAVGADYLTLEISQRDKLRVGHADHLKPVWGCPLCHVEPDTTSNPDPEQVFTSTGQCTATTKSGNYCKRRAVADGLCKSHGE